MAVIKKYGDVLPTPLTNFGTFVKDTNSDSTYFRISEFKDVFTAGKNGFLIEGSEFLKESTEIKIQILDVNGDPIYYEPGNGIPEYYEGVSKVVAVYVYEDTPIGNAKITILGELKNYVDDSGVIREVPDEWKGVYNVKWEKTFTVNNLLPNEDRVRFYRRPKVSIEEIVKSIYFNEPKLLTQSGSLRGISISPSQNESLATFTQTPQYYLQITDNSNWTGSVVDNIVTTDIGYSPTITEVINNKYIAVNTPYTDNLGFVQNLNSVGYTASFLYLEDVSNLKTALTGSFAEITIADLETFIGDVARVKIFRKSLSTIGDYQFIQEIQLESNELLVDNTTSIKNQEFYGLFTEKNYNTYWVTSSNDLSTDFNQSYLYNSVALNSLGTNYFYTSKSISLSTDVQYTLNLNARISASYDSDNYIRVFISGSRPYEYNNISTTVGASQDILLIDDNPRYLQKTSFSQNFIAEEFINPKLYIEVKGYDWYVSDISLRASQETSYSPNEITFIQPVPRSLERETFDYRFDFYDINNNYIPVVVNATKTFTGGNLQRIEKRLSLNPSQNYFQFDSGSNPVAPTTITFNIEKTLLTGSVNFTSQSIDFFGNVLSASMYPTGGFPGLLSDITASVPYMTVAAFTGSRADIIVQNVVLTGECEGITDTVVITRLLDGFGGVNHIIRPYNGTTIRNSSTQSLEIQAVRIDGVNDIELYSGSRPERGWYLIQLHLLSSSFSESIFVEKFVNLEYASSSGFVKGLTKGTLGSGEINFNAVFNRDSIDKKVTVYLMPSASAASNYAYITSASVLATINLEDLQDGLDTPVVTYNADTFTINYRDEFSFRPVSASATASFYRRGTNSNPISASIEVYPSMSINKDYVPEYWIYYVSGAFDSDISITTVDESGNEIVSTPYGTYVGSPLTQSKILTTTFTYTEPYTSTSISIDKTFTIVPEGKPGDESIVFELVPSNITLNSNAKGFISNYKPADTELKLKQGARYLAFSSSKDPGTFWLNYVTQSNIVSGAVNYNNTSSLLITSMSNMTQLSGSLTYELLIHPYFTSSRYTQSLVQNFTKAVDGAPPIEILLEPGNIILQGTETGFVKSYTPANTEIQLREGSEYLIYTSSKQRGTWYFESISGSNVQTQSVSSATSGTSTRIGTVSFTNFLPPAVSASVFYLIKAHPYSLLPGHVTGSVNLFTTQSFTKNNDPVAARTVNLAATTNVVEFDGDGVVVVPQEPIVLTATAYNTTSSLVYYQFFKYDYDAADWEIKSIPQQNFDILRPFYDSEANQYTMYPDEATAPGEVAVWKVEIRDGHHLNEVRATGETTISGIKAGQDPFTSLLSNANSSIQVGLWETTYTGSGTLVNAYKSGFPLTHTSSYVPSQIVYYEFGNLQGQPIGHLGYYSASIVSKSPHITLAPQNRLLGNPASIGEITNWTAPAVNTSAEVRYKVDFEGGRATQYHTQSLGVQITPAAPYSARLSNENCSVIYRVSGEMEFDFTDTEIRVFRGDVELVNTASMITGEETHIDMYGNPGWKGKCKVTILSKSSYLNLVGGLTATSHVAGTPASMGGIVSWLSPETYPKGEIVYAINCEGRETLIKTQSISIQFEGETGPGIVMRGVWTGSLDYIGSMNSVNQRRDAVIWPDPETINQETHYWAAISGSGPGTPAGPQQPDGTAPYNDTDYWQYLGQEEFFVAGQIAIFRESYVKNTINVGTKDGTGEFANIVLAGGRNDPYMAIGQSGIVGDSGDQSTPGVIGYDRPGIFLGIYEDGANGTTGRFSIKTSDTSGKGMFWDGSQLTIVGAIRQISPGVPEGRLMGAWTDGIQYYTNDIVTYSGNTWTANSNHVSSNNTSPTTGYPGYGPWTIAPIAAKLVRLEASSQVFIEAQDGTLSPNWIELTANKQNISAITNWTTSPSVTLYDSSTGGSVATTGDTVYLRKADFGANNLVQITATADSIADTVTVARVREGTDALTIILTNESHTVPAANDGTVSSYANSGTDIYIYEGATQLDYDGSGTTSGKWTVSATPTNITAGAITDGGNYASVGAHSSMTANQATVSFSISGKKLNGDSFTITRVQSLTKSVAGADGSPGAPGAAGAGVVYRGRWTEGTIYYKSTTRVDVVKGADAEYYLAKSTHTAAAGQDPTGGSGISGTPATYWESFGATFSSVATDILFANDVYANRTINIGEGLTPVMQLNADYANAGASPFMSIGQTSTSGSGYDKPGIFLGIVTGSALMSLKNPSNDRYIRWNGSDLEVQGQIKAVGGYLGSGNDVWQIQNAVLYSSASVGQIRFNAARPAIEIYDSGSRLAVDINTNNTLSPLTAVTIAETGSIGGVTTYPTQESIVSPTNDTTQYEILEVEGPQQSSSPLSFWVPSTAAGLTAVIRVNTGGQYYGAGRITGVNAGALTRLDMQLYYGIKITFTPTSTGIESAPIYETLRSSFASKTYTINPFTYEFKASDTLVGNMISTFTIPITFIGGGIYKIYTFARSFELRGWSSYQSWAPNYTWPHKLTLYNWDQPALYTYSSPESPAAPSVTDWEVDVATSKTEIIAGGFQVAYSTNRYVQIPRKGDGAMLRVGGQIEVNDDIFITPTNYSSPNIGDGSYRFDTIFAKEFNNGTSSLGPIVGYSKLSNGLIVQSGTVYGTVVDTPLTFPVAFPNECYGVTCATIRNSSGANGYNHVYNVTQAGARLILDAPYDAYWIAVGR